MALGSARVMRWGEGAKEGDLFYIFSEWGRTETKVILALGQEKARRKGEGGGKVVTGVGAPPPVLQGMNGTGKRGQEKIRQVRV